MPIEIERGLVKSRYGYLHYRAAGQGQPIVLLHINQQTGDGKGLSQNDAPLQKPPAIPDMVL